MPFVHWKTEDGHEFMGEVSDELFAEHERNIRLAAESRRLERQLNVAFWVLLPLSFVALAAYLS